MNVFLQKYLEAPTQSSSIKAESWQWTPEGEFAQEIYASGAATKTRESTYAAEKDNSGDSDRPNEGFMAA